MGLLEIGYHLVIDRDGCVHRIRDVLCVGSHCPGYNHISVGVCLIGGIDEDGSVPVDNFTDHQRTALGNIILGFVKEWPKARVMGHNELKGYQQHRRCPAIHMDVVRATVPAVPGHGKTLTELTTP